MEKSRFLRMEMANFSYIKEKVLMKTMRFLTALLLICGLFACGKERTSTGSVVGKKLIVKSVQRCPNGHTTIKPVPMVYGFVEVTPETERKEANYEAAYGGCDEDSNGKYKFVCTTCGSYTYEKFFDKRDDKPTWFDKTTEVIPPGKAIVTAELVHQN
jgi:hypothetical protein